MADPAKPPAAPEKKDDKGPLDILSSKLQPLEAKPTEVIPETLDRVVIYSYPKAVYLYPLFVLSVIFGLLRVFDLVSPSTLGFIWVTVFFFNVLVISFEFTRMVSVALVLFALVLFLTGVLLNQHYQIVAKLAGAFDRIHMEANAQFYFGIAIAFFIAFIGIYIDTRWDYWEVRSNEVLHHHGFLGDVERFPAPNLKINKEITDVFEYLLLMSGRLVLYPAGSTRAIVLDNVPRINRVEKLIDELLGELEVRIDTKGRGGVAPAPPPPV